MGLYQSMHAARMLWCVAGSCQGALLWFQEDGWTHSADAVAIAVPLHEPALVQGPTQTALELSPPKGHGSIFEGAVHTGGPCVSCGGGTGCAVGSVHGAESGANK